MYTNQLPTTQKCLPYQTNDNTQYTARLKVCVAIQAYIRYLTQNQTKEWSRTEFQIR